MKLTVFLLVVSYLVCAGGCTYSQQKTRDFSNHKAMQVMNIDHSDNPYYSHTDTAELHVPLSEWKQILPEEVYHIAFEKGTERAFSGKYWDYEGLGTYYCAVCGNKLFRSDAKFASTCGWPSFFEPSRKNAVLYKPDHSFDMDRTEVLCARCHAHLGHVFHDGPPPTGLRYCMNSPVLDFVPDQASSAAATGQ